MPLGGQEQKALLGLAKRHLTAGIIGFFNTANDSTPGFQDFWSNISTISGLLVITFGIKSLNQGLIAAFAKVWKFFE